MAIDPGLFLSQVTLFLSLALPLPTLRAHASSHNSAEMWGYLYSHTLFLPQSTSFCCKTLFIFKPGWFLGFIFTMFFFSFPLSLVFFSFSLSLAQTKKTENQGAEREKQQLWPSGGERPEAESVPKQRLACLPHPHGCGLKA